VLAQDPSQNDTFRDHFLDVPVDMSKVSKSCDGFETFLFDFGTHFDSFATKVLFMCTANDLDTIPGPLLDRMEIVRLSGYDVPEKIQIAEHFLVPKALQESGLVPMKSEESSYQSSDESLNDENQSDSELNVAQQSIPESLAIERSAIDKLVRWYCREAGVRNLNKYIEKISRKLALQIVAEEEGAQLREESKRKSDTWVVTEDNLEDYVGKPIYTSDRLYDKDPLPHGVVMGLAWTSMGGELYEIENIFVQCAPHPSLRRRFTF
jgi:Lon-like ATP-dependent protease